MSTGNWYREPILFDIDDKVRTTWHSHTYGPTYEGVIVGIGYSAEQWLVQQDDGKVEMVHEDMLERIDE